MVDHSRSNRIIQAAHDRGDIKPPPAAVLRQRLRAGAYGSVEVLLGETLSNEQLDKLLAWAADNVVPKFNAAGNIMPDKQKCAEKIDPIVATIMALSESLFEPAPEKSV